MSIEPFIDDFQHRDWETNADGVLRFAVIGLGWWTVEEAIPALEAADLCEPTVAVSGSAEKAGRVAEDVDPITRGITYDEFHDSAAIDEYDAVYICSPNALHLPYVETAATNGKAVLCEKPMEATSDRARRMISVCAEEDVPLAIGYRMQTEPAIRRARELIQHGVIGDPVHALGTNSQSLLDLIDDPDQWRLDPDLAGPGATVMDIGIYPLNTLRYLIDADPKAAQAFMHSEHDAFDTVPDEHTAFTLTYDDGTYLACTASQNAQATTSLRVVGTEGEIYVEPAYHMETEIRITRGETTMHLDTPQVDQMQELFAYFAHRVLADEPMTLTGSHGLVDLQAMEAIYEAGTTGETVEIELET